MPILKLHVFKQLALSKENYKYSFIYLQKYLKVEFDTQEISPMEWALRMADETTQLDTIALTAIRNMLDVSGTNLKFF